MVLDKILQNYLNGDISMSSLDYVLSGKGFPEKAITLIHDRLGLIK
ncbi:MAG: hypothetical protein GWN01_08975 [Nitrosopumilaceae archaeon]|nr:hypothetical protein [Nitrosopumilaceae archaeon]NIU87475.1 hypothetical protein [Nitrosopumilaceae archaeon]NIX61643.1 hypothetical protein [Nitrosopumilaceae archaeon]